MNAFARALVLASGPGGFEEDRLPRSLSESFDLPVEAPAEADHAVFVGIHLGSAGAIDGKHPSFLAGFEWRIHILPWLAAAGGGEYQTEEPGRNYTAASLLAVPFLPSVLPTPP